MNIVIWILQLLLALAFLASAVMKVSQPRTTLAPRMPYVEDFSDRTVKAIGAVEILGAVGVVLPAWTGIAPILTPIAATGLAIVMIGAALTHLRRKEPQAIAVNAVLFAIAAVLAVLRFGPYSYWHGRHASGDLTDRRRTAKASGPAPASARTPAAPTGHR